MMPSNVFEVELASSFATRRAIVLRLGLPLLLGLPFVLFEMPAEAKAAGITMLLLFLTFLGASVGHARREREGRLAALRLLPVPRWLGWSDLLLAGSVTDLCQMTPVIGLIVVMEGRGLGIGPAMGLAVPLVTTVLVLNALGMLLATCFAENAEIHLLGALGTSFLAFLSGVFPVPGRLSALVDMSARLSPVAWFDEHLVALLAGRPTDFTSTAVVAVLPGIVFLWVLMRLSNVPSVSRGQRAPGTVD